jgi:spoIIIJ-associated protein
VSIRTTEAAAERIEDALASTLADLLACDVDDIEVRVDGPGLAELGGRWHVEVSFAPGSGTDAPDAGQAPEDLPAAQEPEQREPSAGDAGSAAAGDEAAVPVIARDVDAGDEDAHDGATTALGADVGAPDRRDTDAGDEDADSDGSSGSADDASEPTDGADRPADDSLDALEEEAEAAADFVEGLLDALDLPGDLRIRYDADHAEVEVVDVGSGALIGRRGQTLEAIQELLRCSLQREFQRRARVKVDVEGYRSRRLERLLEKADEAIDAVLDTGEPERLEPMDVFERKAIHHRVAEVEGLVSRSQGREPARRVIIERG